MNKKMKNTKQETEELKQKHAQDIRDIHQKHQHDLQTFQQLQPQAMEK